LVKFHTGLWSNCIQYKIAWQSIYNYLCLSEAGKTWQNPQANWTLKSACSRF